MQALGNRISNTTFYGYNWKDLVSPTLRIANVVILARILQRGECPTLSLGIDIAAHYLAAVVTSDLCKFTKIVNIFANFLRAAAFLYGSAEAPLATLFGGFAVGIHVVNVIQGCTMWKEAPLKKSVTHLRHVEQTL